MIFTDLNNILNYLKTHGKFIGQDAAAGDEKAHQVIIAYAALENSVDPAKIAFLMEATETYLKPWARSQICRICCQPLELRWQPDIAREGYFLYTCGYKGCPMWMMTLGSREYSTMALNPYLKGKVTWQWDYDVLIEKTRHLYPEGWQRQARSIRKLIGKGRVAGEDHLHDWYDTARAIASVTIHKTPPGETPF